MTKRDTPIDAAAVWNAARAATEKAPDDWKDGAHFVLLQIESAIAAAPVVTLADAALKIRIAHAMAQRQDDGDEVPWQMVRKALDHLRIAE